MDNTLDYVTCYYLPPSMLFIVGILCLMANLAAVAAAIILGLGGPYHGPLPGPGGPQRRSLAGELGLNCGGRTGEKFPRSKTGAPGGEDLTLQGFISFVLNTEYCFIAIKQNIKIDCHCFYSLIGMIKLSVAESNLRQIRKICQVKTGERQMTDDMTSCCY